MGRPRETPVEPPPNPRAAAGQMPQKGTAGCSSLTAWRAAPRRAGFHRPSRPTGRKSPRQTGEDMQARCAPCSPPGTQALCPTPARLVTLAVRASLVRQRGGLGLSPAEPAGTMGAAAAQRLSPAVCLLRSPFQPPAPPAARARSPAPPVTVAVPSLHRRPGAQAGLPALPVSHVTAAGGALASWRRVSRFPGGTR